MHEECVSDKPALHELCVELMLMINDITDTDACLHWLIIIIIDFKFFFVGIEKPNPGKYDRLIMSKICCRNILKWFLLRKC